MNISSNSLFQFTNSIEIVKKIITDKFYGSYCREIFHYNNETIPLIIPMICFCDIPLETIVHYRKYGNYGIGLKKEWGIRNKLNPVLYIEKNSLMADSLVKALFGSMRVVELTQPRIDELHQRLQLINENQKMSPSQKIIGQLTILNELKKLQEAASPMQHMIYSIYYSKHYSDDLERDGKVIKDYRFYDEREWRYLPEFSCAVCQLRRTEEEYRNWRGVSEQKPLLPEVGLSFSADDVDHIIIDEEKEAKEIIETIKALSKFNDQEKETLLSKIISFQKIQSLSK